MLMSTTYTFNAAHWCDGYAYASVFDVPREDVYKAIHGHNWTAEVDVQGEPDEYGLLANYVDIHKAVGQFDFTFLPAHPLVLSYLCDKYSVSERGLKKLPEMLFAGSTEMMVYVLAREIHKAIQRPGLRMLHIRLHETGPNALRNVNNIYVDEVFPIDPDTGKPLW